jgi:hypothetical protein
VTSANQRLAQAGLKLGIPGESEITDDDAHAAQGGNRVILVTDGWQGALVVRQAAAAEAPDRRWTTAFVVAILLVTAWLLLRLALVRDFLAAQAPAIVAASGLGWSLIAPWPWLGWIAVGLAIWLAIRLPRMRPSYS